MTYSYFNKNYGIKICRERKGKAFTETENKKTEGTRCCG